MQTDQDIAALESAVQTARQALAATEAARAELQAGSEPTSDLAAELRRVQDLQNKQAAYDRVIVAQRRELAAAEAALLATIEPRLRAELAQIDAEMQAKVQEAGRHLWEAHRLVSGQALPVHERIAAIKLQIKDSGATYPAPIVQQLNAAEANIGKALCSLGLAVAYAGIGGVGIRPALTEEQRQAEKAQQAQDAQKARRKWLAGLQRGSSKVDSGTED